MKLYSHIFTSLILPSCYLLLIQIETISLHYDRYISVVTKLYWNDEGRKQMQHSLVGAVIFQSNILIRSDTSEFIPFWQSV